MTSNTSDTVVVPVPAVGPGKQLSDLRRKSQHNIVHGRNAARPAGQRSATSVRNRKRTKFLLYSLSAARYWDGTRFNATRNGSIFDVRTQSWNINATPAPHVFASADEAMLVTNDGVVEQRGYSNYVVVAVR